MGRAALLLPPPRDPRYCELRRVVRRADNDVAGILRQVVDAERDCQAFRRAREVVLVDLRGLPAPRLPLASEVADQLFLLRIHADNGQPGFGEGGTLGCDVAELLVSGGGVPADAPPLPDVGLHGEAQALEQAPHRLLLTGKPFSRSRSANFLTLLRTHFCSVIGSPATSLLSNASSAAVTAGCFCSVRGLPPTGCGARSRDLPSRRSASCRRPYATVCLLRLWPLLEGGQVISYKALPENG